MTKVTLTKREAASAVTLTRSELRKKSGRDFSSGDIICVGKYIIHIEYGKYKTPSLNSWVENAETGRIVSSWPAGARGCWPYFIGDFLRREPAP